MNGLISKEAMDLISDIEKKKGDIEKAVKELSGMGRLDDLAVFGLPDVKVGSLIEGKVIGGSYSQYKSLIIEELLLIPNCFLEAPNGGRVIVNIRYRPYTLQLVPFKNSLHGIITIRNKDRRVIEY